MTAAASSADTLVREAAPSDLPDVVRLLSARDNRRRDPQVVSDYLWGLSPEHVRAWIAYVGDQPAGFTMFYLREMNWPQLQNSPPIDDRLVRAGYWAHLFVDFTNLEFATITF